MLLLGLCSTSTSRGQWHPGGGQARALAAAGCESGTVPRRQPFRGALCGCVRLQCPPLHAPLPKPTWPIFFTTVYSSSNLTVLFFVRSISCCASAIQCSLNARGDWLAASPCAAAPAAACTPTAFGPGPPLVPPPVAAGVAPCASVGPGPLHRLPIVYGAGACPPTNRRLCQEPAPCLPPVCGVVVGGGWVPAQSPAVEVWSRRRALCSGRSSGRAHNPRASIPQAAEGKRTRLAGSCSAVLVW